MTNDQFSLFGKLVLYLLPPAAAILLVKLIIRKLIFSVIQDKQDGLPLFKSIIDTIYADRKELVDGLCDKMDSIEGRVGASELAITRHTIEIGELQEESALMPRWIDAVERIDKNIDRFAVEMVEIRKDLVKVREDFARLEGRWDGQERRKPHTN